jgi:hypothetical protein
LNALPSSLTHLRNTAQTAAARLGFRIDVVANQNQHDGFTSQ